MDDLDELLTDQCGLLTVGQAVAHGLSRKAVAHRVSTQRWQRVHPGVYATWTGALDAEQRIWAGYLYAGIDAVVTHRSAWWLAERSQPEPEVVQVAVPNCRTVASQPGLVVIRPRRLDPRDLHPTARPSRFRVERAVLDCVAASADEQAAAALLTSAVQRRITTPQRLEEALARSANLPRRALVEDVLHLTKKGAHSLLEVAHDDACTSHGLPTPDRQRRIGDSEVDAAHDMPLGTLVTELDGKAGHFDSQSWWADMQRDNRHTTAGLRTLRFPGFVVLRQPHRVAATTAEALMALGWEGALRCPPGCPGG